MSVRPGPARTASRAACLVLVTVLGAACAAPPQKEMDQADGAIATARAAGAAQYASEEFSAAEAALKRSHDAVAQRDYRQALNHALDARERAQTAAREAADKMAIARGQAERAITAAELALATAQQRVQAARRPVASPPRRAVPTPGLAALETTVAAVTTRLQEARSHLQTQRYDKALEVAMPLAPEIQGAVTRYDEARAQTPPARSGRRGR